MKRLSVHIAATALLTLLSLTARADGAATSTSPYSKFGVGNLCRSGTVYTNGMGKIGTATRDNRFINIMNPASVTARDSLSLMSEFSVSQQNVYFRQDDLSSVDNTFNINNLTMSFPIWKSSAMMFGLNPYSCVNYSIVDNITDPQTIGYTGSAVDYYTGEGGLYQIYVAAGATFFKRLSVGAEFDYFFGDIAKTFTREFSSSSFSSLCSDAEVTLSGCTGKFGLQYEQPLGKNRSLVFGGTYRLAARMTRGSNTAVTYRTQSSVLDTLSCSFPSIDNVCIPSEWSVGVSYKHKDKWRAEVNYTQSDWTTSGMNGIKGLSETYFATKTSRSVNAGFEIVPNRNDIRYYMKRCSYRVGAYWTDEYYTCKGNNISSVGITLGMSLPIWRWYNALSVAVDFGQRSNFNDPFADGLIRERYVNFSVAINIFDIWFVKPKYE